VRGCCRWSEELHRRCRQAGTIVKEDISIATVASLQPKPPSLLLVQPTFVDFTAAVELPIIYFYISNVKLLEI
jgi:hypothetical protein